MFLLRESGSEWHIAVEISRVLSIFLEKIKNDS